MGLIVCSIYGRVPITGGEGMLVLGQKARVSEKVGSGAARNVIRFLRPRLME